ncbi:unnamed protein product [Protopolystoma xenopodis]|uniref:Peptidase M24 domain-containing protein n=1 Tax=Protopolystoma xenopodis TaxID=117903 RepID=A0A3S5ATA1_9PLAT|nr:unnamed protein product [Protopolystoma xenopodis]
MTTGVVFTIEPGLYFPRSKNIPVNKDFSDIGIRLEDDYVISKDGVALKLSETLPYRPEEIEKLVGKQKQI